LPVIIPFYGKAIGLVNKRELSILGKKKKTSALQVTLTDVRNDFI
jgi:hypothetical protein